MLANGASKTLVGKNFFGDYTQKFINHNPRLNNLTRNLLMEILVMVFMITEKEKE